MKICASIWAIVAVGWIAGSVGSAQSRGPDAAALFQQHCASCHTDSENGRAPTRAALGTRTPESVLGNLTAGVMATQGWRLTIEERRAVAEFVTGRKLTPGDPLPAVARCSTPTPLRDPSQGPMWNGWGSSVTNTRFQPANQAGLTAAQVPKLKLKWAFGFPNASAAWTQPTVVGGRVFVASQDGVVYALDARSGCVIWTFAADAGVRTAMSIGPARKAGAWVAYFGDISANAYAIDAATGKLLWKRHVDEHRLSRITGAPTLYRNLLYVPVSGVGEETGSNSPGYKCCTFRGSVVALDTETGAIRWKTFAIDEEAKPNGKVANGTPLWGPAGASIWNSPTIDAKRNVLYVGTGNMFTEPAKPTANAILAMDLATGKIKWSNQRTADDVFRSGCGQERECGPDVDFAGSPMIVTLPGGRDLIVAGQKSGVAWGLDPDKDGAVVWQYKASQGGLIGGIEFGGAADGDRAYFAVSDEMTKPAGGQKGGLHAVKLGTGERVWLTPAPEPLCGQERKGCSAAQVAAVTVIPGVVFSGSNDGGFRAYSTESGSLLWVFDTNGEFNTVNKVPAKGGSISGPGATVAGGMLYVNSGYGFIYGRPGNVLLAFGVD